MNEDYANCMLSGSFEADIAVAKARLSSMSWDFLNQGRDDSKLYDAMVLTYAMFEIVASRGADDPSWREFVSDALNETLWYAMESK